MRARSSERGFTFPELVMVIVIVGVLAAVAIPKFDGLSGTRSESWRDELSAGLRYAHQTAISHRRLVCATVSGGQLTLSIAAANPASACGSTLASPNGSSSFTTTTTSTVTPSFGSTLYFQPSGRVSTDGAGTGVSTSYTVTIAGASTPVLVYGETGHVE
jgi:prepilin-type N-terminal cleavage/methylation domain-containing protein